jgi:hypothetical protein
LRKEVSSRMGLLLFRAVVSTLTSWKIPGQAGAEVIEYINIQLID